MTNAGVQPDQTWPPYEVLCVGLDSVERPDGHRHIESAETRDPDGGHTRWGAPGLLAALRIGERFVVVTDDPAAEATLASAFCPTCRSLTVTIDPPTVDATPCE